MTYRIRVSLVMLMSSSYLTISVAAQQAEPSRRHLPQAEELSFFDYLGALVEGEDGWIDPLTLLEDAEETTAESTTQDTGENPAVGSSVDREVAK